MVDGVAAFRPIQQLVFDADVREGPAHHDLVVPAAGAVGVELVGFDAAFFEPLAGGEVLAERPGGLMWSVVTVSPSVSRQRASAMSSTPGSSSGKS